jgi:hydroxyacylglutathione hydrolase
MLTINSIPAFNDNYIWLINNNDTGCSENGCAVVDPGQAEPVLEYLKQHQLTLEAILITHHHADHTGGITALLRAFPQAKVVGPADEAIPSMTHGVSDGDQIALFGHTFDIMSLPGHTLGHIAYLGDKKLFCGDVLFSAGCGRVFEGTYEQMFTSLQRLRALPDETQVYCAHEYTTSNLLFALAVEPGNQDLLNYREQVQQRRSNNQPTLPTSLAVEKRINPFLRLEEVEVIQSVANRTENNSAIGIFAALREWKNQF